MLWYVVAKLRNMPRGGSGVNATLLTNAHVLPITREVFNQKRAISSFFHSYTLGLKPIPVKDDIVVEN